MFYGAADVIGRYFFNHPVKWTYELSQILLACIVFLGMAYTLYRDKHTTIGFVYNRFSSTAKKIVDVFTRLLSLGAFILFTWQSIKWGITYMEADRQISGIFIPFYPFQFLVAFCAMLVCLELIIQLVYLILPNLENPEKSQEVQS